MAHRSRLLPLSLSLTLPLALPATAAAQGPPAAKLPIREVTSFKNGLALVRIAGDRLECDVRDTGPGIAAADAARLFAAFQRGAPQQSGAVPGLGLGLSIARGLAEALGGDLALCDTGPHGTTFRLRLPRARSGR